MRLWLAIRSFFTVLSDANKSEAIGQVLQGEVPETQPRITAEPRQPEAPPKPKRSEALTLLAALQREARFVDIVKEPLNDYSDDQIGAAARDVLRDCGEVLERMFGIQPAVDQEEGESLEAPAGSDASRFRLTGNVSGEPPYRGTVVHRGWQASKCELPQWSGKPESALVVAPVELEVG